MSDAGFELRPWVSLPMGRTSERASERAVLSRFDAARAHPPLGAAGRCAMIRRAMLTFAHRLVLSLTATLALAAPAGAAEVARIDGASLDARDSTRVGFCLRVTEGRSESGGGSRTCGRAPWRARRSNLVTWSSGERL